MSTWCVLCMSDEGAVDDRFSHIQSHDDNTVADWCRAANDYARHLFMTQNRYFPELVSNMRLYGLETPCGVSSAE